MRRNIQQRTALRIPNMALLVALIFLCGVYSNQAMGQQGGAPLTAAFDVINYSAEIEPDLTNNTLKGKESFRFIARADRLSEIEINCGELTIDNVLEHGAPLKFSTKDRKLHIALLRPARAN